MAAELAIVLPAMMLFLCFAIEVGVFALRSAMFERSVDFASRTMRLQTESDTQAAMTYDEYKAAICDNIAIIGNSYCISKVQVEVQPMADIDLATWRGGQAVCNDRFIDTADPISDTTFVPGSSSEMMIIRACLPVDSFFPGVLELAGLRHDENGDFRMISINAFVQEPT